MPLSTTPSKVNTFQGNLLKKLSKVKHSFSHYNLEAIPYLAKLESNKKYKNSVWVDYKNVESLGLPAPIKKTINQLTKP